MEREKNERLTAREIEEEEMKRELTGNSTFIMVIIGILELNAVVQREREREINFNFLISLTKYYEVYISYETYFRQSDICVRF